MSRGARFACVGAAGFGVQLLTLYALTAAGLPYPAATALAVEAAILHNFLWHERWTWADRADVTTAPPKPAGRRWKAGRDGQHSPAGRVGRLLRFNGATAVISVGGNVALTGVFVGWLHLPLPAANLLAVLVLSALNFVSADRFVFTGRA